MNGGVVLGVLLCVAAVLAAVFAFEIAVFRAACAISGVPRPGVPKSVGLVAVLLVVPGLVDAAGYGVLHRVYEASRYPLWEADLVQFFLALPVHMGICSLIHARMMRVRLGDAVGVWLVEKVLKLFVLAAAAGVVGAVLLATRLK